ncbi:MAG: N-acetylmuramoyl-L-alanine amidase [Crocinitomicaceae bacterium]|nr:N-acetylmuramoyl-L-alanine amidase [Crocinitomicaceae bacterium]
MKKFAIVLAFLPLFLIGQINFSSYYMQHTLPEGILEAYSWAHTHMQNIDDSYLESCSGMPLPYGVMGLFDNGKNYFIENAALVETLSGISIADQKSSVSLQIEAFASAFEQLYNQNNQGSTGERIYQTLLQLSEIPTSGMVNQYARDIQAFEVLKLLNDPKFAQKHNFHPHSIDYIEIFGANNFEILSAKRVLLPQGKVVTPLGDEYLVPANRTAQYGPALWVAADPSNYSSRAGTPVSAITIHTIQGSYGGAISWAQNPTANVSYHYVIQSSDGQVTQMVLEEDKAWHVGSENPYTIGYEHEGFVTDPSWYTEEMYISSADLSRDITQSGYGINPLRTYFGPASDVTDLLGGCTKIKGHQHYANQTHTDPGIYWNWEKYYRLINDNPAIQAVTATSGNLTDSGGSGNDYSDDERLLWLIQPPQTANITLTFSTFETELDWDYLYIYDGNSINSPLIGVYTGTNSPGTITSSGGSLLLEFRSDCATTAPGWEASYTSVQVDATSPTTGISVPGTWQTTDFTSTFTDQDNAGGSGIEQSFYHVGHYDGSHWSANPSKGFYFDDFTTASFQPVWTQQTGTWQIAGGNLSQTDEGLSNTNIYMGLDQTLSNNYLYHWKGSIGGSGTNRRAGLHILCDDPTAINRQASYFIWFRVDDNKIQFYRVDNDNFGSPLVDLPYQIDPNTVYDFKFSFDRISGEMLLFIDDVLAANWTDSNPIQSGNYISFRTGNASMTVEELTVYRSRNPSALITIGADTTKVIRFQNPNPNTASGRIQSITRDASENISSIVTELINIDWTQPLFASIEDGNTADIDTTYSTTLEANWSTATDPNSGLQMYEIAIGTTAGATDVLNWTNGGLVQTYSHILASPIYDQIYYYSVKATNNAGLDSILFSDGQRLVSSLNVTENELEQIELYPNPSQEYFTLKTNKPVDVKVFNATGQLVFENKKYAGQEIQVSHWAEGVYSAVIREGNWVVVKKLVVD